MILLTDQQCNIITYRYNIFVNTFLGLQLDPSSERFMGKINTVKLNINANQNKSCGEDCRVFRGIFVRTPAQDVATCVLAVVYYHVFIESVWASKINIWHANRIYKYRYRCWRCTILPEMVYPRYVNQTTCMSWNIINALLYIRDIKFCVCLLYLHIRNR